MKTVFLTFNILLLSMFVNAQNSLTINTGEAVLVYSLPKTELSIIITTDKVTEKPGVFYRYSERYLATDKVITEENTTYEIKSIEVKAHSVADASRTYSFVPQKKSNISNISVDKQGILSGINIPYIKENKENKESEVRRKKTSEVASSKLLPLGEEYMMAGSEAKLAEGAAKQIYRIRESRMGILTTDVEHLPADGSSFKTVLNGLNNLETQLTELFIGETTHETTTQIINYTPTSAVNNEVLFRISAHNGVVAKDDLSGKPFYISVAPNAAQTVDNNSKSKKAESAINYIQPASTLISIGDGLNSLYNEKLDIPQFGELIPLSNDFVNQANIKIKFDTKTGRILSIE